jgi:hypothetical protein
MSLYQSVWVELPCEKCSVIRKTPVRFHSAVRYDADYIVGEPVPVEDELVPNEIYEGNATRYCRECLCLWAIALAQAAYDSLADLMEQKLVAACLKDQVNPLSSEQIAPLKDAYINAMQDRGIVYATIPFFEELQIALQGRAVIKGESSWLDFLDLISPLTEKKLRQDGWKHGETTWKDFRVFLDSQRCLFVEEIEGNGISY